ncbi:N-ATPase, AtpR subunit [Sulfitobacter marinus]|uniref:N-ATPase, AtpR subunit n=1 Tax=Sulfitobacter marinus TaxID=394264 RepID=A0A1I6VBC3_9RHOB|nr:ATP synthase subunit I [Sulfitobacter marinus]SFT11038.1 N-ATPase, AtpR subunit [Sulfitobacter marinus]
MSGIDWAPVLMGAAVGLALSTLFFAGLAIGMRQALRRENPVMMLALSAAIRISVLLAVGWLVLGQGGLWAAAGYALAFLLARLIATTFARMGIPARGTT